MKYTNLLFLALTAAIACHTPGMQHAGTKTAGFTANPQPIPERPVKTLEIGATAPDFNLPGTDGKFYSLKDFAPAKVLVIMFTCNHCPTAQAYEDRIKAFAADYKDKGVQLVAISPNSPLGLLYEELGYTDLDDNYSSMIIRAKNKQFSFPYLYDGDTESASLQYGPAATPHAFVFDKERKLRYTGRLDKTEKPGSANAEDLRAATDAVLAGKTPAVETTKTFGCSTKWAWKTEHRASVEQAWNEKQVTLTRLDAAGIRKVLQNNDSKKLRLINVWATWCGPCVLEYPDFIVLQRMYGARDFEFVSISADKAEREPKVLEFLKKQHSAVSNYLFAGADQYALIDVVDKNWNGALPYTILVEPGGKIVWSKQGDVHIPDLKKVIVEHPMIGRYF
jgi:peroxiredoxin